MRTSGPTQEPDTTVTVLETSFLDLDGDGVPDAVEVVEAVTHHHSGPDGSDLVEIVETVAKGIGIDGVPSEVDVIDMGAVDVLHAA